MAENTLINNLLSVRSTPTPIDRNPAPDRGKDKFSEHIQADEKQATHSKDNDKQDQNDLSDENVEKAQPAHEDGNEAPSGEIKQKNDEPRLVVGQQALTKEPQFDVELALSLIDQHGDLSGEVVQTANLNPDDLSGQVELIDQNQDLLSQTGEVAEILGGSAGDKLEGQTQNAQLGQDELLGGEQQLSLLLEDENQVVNTGVISEQVNKIDTGVVNNELAGQVKTALNKNQQVQNGGGQNLETGEITDGESSAIQTDSDALQVTDTGEVVTDENNSSLLNQKLNPRSEQVDTGKIQHSQSQFAVNTSGALENLENGVGGIQSSQTETGAVNLANRLGASQQAGQVPMHSLAMHIAKQAQSGAKRFEIMLDPPELGRIEVRLDVARDGSASTHIFVERSETLDLMQRDSRSLANALAEAGLDMGEGNLNFSLKDEGLSGESKEGEGTEVASEDDWLVEEASSAHVQKVLDLYMQSGGGTGIDIRV